MALLGAAIIRLTEAFWTSARAGLETIDTFAGQLVAGVRIGRVAYDDPDVLVCGCEPSSRRGCPRARVRNMSALVLDLAAFWQPYVAAAEARSEIHRNHDLADGGRVGGAVFDRPQDDAGRHDRSR
ncbi:hypothetical protein [Nocardia niwae]|uniref:hypothetical protein n=1 Tax=Nocardia niwae TaxID=626084 RepID=UPI003F4D1CA3